MLVLLEWVLVVAAVVWVLLEAVVVAWKVKIAIRKVVSVVSANPVVAFFAKVAMFAYLTLIVPAIDRAIN